MKTRLAALLTLCFSLGGCVGAAAIGDGRGTTPPAQGEQSPEFAVGCAEWVDPVADPADGALPATTLECLGDDVAQVAMSGKPPRPTILNLWASWCGPCRVEVPILEDFAKLAAGTVDVLGVVTKDSRSNSASFAAEYKMSFPSVLDPDGEVATTMALQALPNSLLIDTDGTVAAIHIGRFETVDEIADLIEAKLGVVI